jgi:hypothetical protein
VACYGNTLDHRMIPVIVIFVEKKVLSKDGRKRLNLTESGIYSIGKLTESIPTYDAGLEKNSLNFKFACEVQKQPILKC